MILAQNVLLFSAHLLACENIIVKKIKMNTLLEFQIQQYLASFCLEFLSVIC